MALHRDIRTALIDAVRDAAARQIMPRFRKLGDTDIRAKSGALDLVTAADTAAEAD